MQAPRWPLALMTVEPSPPWLPSLPGTLLLNILCGNHACWPYLVLLATAKFLLLVPDIPTSNGTFMESKAATSFLSLVRMPSVGWSSALQHR